MLAIYFLTLAVVAALETPEIPVQLGEHVVTNPAAQSGATVRDHVQVHGDLHSNNNSGVAPTPGSSKETTLKSAMNIVRERGGVPSVHTNDSSVVVDAGLHNEDALHLNGSSYNTSLIGALVHDNVTNSIPSVVASSLMTDTSITVHVTPASFTAPPPIVSSSNGTSSHDEPSQLSTTPSNYVNITSKGVEVSTPVPIPPISQSSGSPTPLPSSNSPLNGSKKKELSSTYHFSSLDESKGTTEIYIHEASEEPSKNVNYETPGDVRRVSNVVPSSSTESMSTNVAATKSTHKSSGHPAKMFGKENMVGPSSQHTTRSGISAVSVIVLLVVTALVVLLAVVLVRRARHSWSRRHYSKMDFLVDVIACRLLVVQCAIPVHS